MSYLSSSLPAATFDRARDLPRLEQVALDLTAVEAALGRLDDDTYGRCVVCGDEIDDARLEQSPTAEDCGTHDAHTPWPNPSYWARNSPVRPMSGTEITGSGDFRAQPGDPGDFRAEPGNALAFCAQPGEEDPSCS